VSFPFAVALPEPEIVGFFKALADETRLTIMRLLAQTDLRSGELGDRLRLPHNAVSYHLRQLRTLGLVRDRRSAADARDIYYSIDLDRLQALYRAAGEALPLVAAPVAPDGAPVSAMVLPLRVLFLCTHNSARSQLAEGILRHLGGDRVEAASAGSMPTEVHPFTHALLQEWGIETSRMAAKSVEDVRGQAFDYIITVCDRMREHCPPFPGDPVQMHWSLPDPLDIAEADQQWTVFCAVQRELVTRVRYLLASTAAGRGRSASAHSVGAADATA
jgi:protein-tyrosine-phosphatase